MFFTVYHTTLLVLTEIDEKAEVINDYLKLENATALGSRIPPHAVLLQVNENTPVKLKIIFAI